MKENMKKNMKENLKENMKKNIEENILDIIEDIELFFCKIFLFDNKNFKKTHKKILYH